MAEVTGRGGYKQLFGRKQRAAGFKYKTVTTWKFNLDHNYGYFNVHLQRWNDKEKRSHPYFVFKGKELFVQPGYCWDGASGPTLDTAITIAPSLFHDCAYQALRQGRLPKEYRRLADKDFYRLMLSDNKRWKNSIFLGRLRAWYYYWGVRLGGRSAARRRV